MEVAKRRGVVGCLLRSCSETSLTEGREAIGEKAGGREALLGLCLSTGSVDSMPELFRPLELSLETGPSASYSLIGSDTSADMRTQTFMLNGQCVAEIPTSDLLQKRFSRTTQKSRPQTSTFHKYDLSPEKAWCPEDQLKIIELYNLGCSRCLARA